MSSSEIAAAFRTEHAGLLEAVEAASQNLATLNARLRSGPIHYAEHTMFAERCASLARYLDSAVALAETAHYGPALAVIRSALEHRVFDRLLFLANKYVSIATSVDESTWRSFEAANRVKGKWVGGIHKADRNERNGTVTLVLHGANVRDEDGRTVRQISPYYRFVDSYSSSGGSPRDQAALLRHLVGPAVHVRFARERSDAWRGWLTWSALQDNLRINRLQTARELLHLRIHYSFLSAFTHPETDTTASLYGTRFGGGLRYDHFASELVLLYAGALAGREIEDFLERCRRAPIVSVVEEDLAKGVAATAREHSASVWFPGDPPHELDRVRDANDRLWRRKGPHEYLGLTPPPRLPASVLRIDQNPLARLIAMHRHDNEVVGYSFLSPWPRADAEGR